MSVEERVRAPRAPLSVRTFRQIWWAQLASELGDAAGRIALAVLVTERSGTPIAAGAVLAVSVLPYLGLGQWITARCERFPRKTVLIVSDLVRAACYLGMAIDQPLWSRFVLLFIASAASPPFESVRNASVPATLTAEQLSDGFALQVLTNEATRLIGLVLGGVGATVASPTIALAVNAGTFLISAALIARIDDDPTPDELRQSVRVRDGWEAIRHDGIVRRIAWMSPLLVAFGAIPEALVVPYTEDELHRTAAVAGGLAALISASILILAPVLPRKGDDKELVRQAATFAIYGAGLSCALFALPPSVAVAALAYAAIGPVFIGRVNLGTAMSLRVPDHLRASTFSLVDGFVSVGQVVAGLGGGILAELIGARPTFVLAMAATTVVGGVAYARPLRVHAAVRSRATG